MFDIGFSELALIAIVALVVLGPERLPEAARALGKWVGRARRMMRELTEELEREVDVSDLREQFREAKRSVEEEWDAAGKSDATASDDDAQEYDEADTETETAASGDDGDTRAGAPTLEEAYDVDDDEPYSAESFDEAARRVYEQDVEDEAAEAVAEDAAEEHAEADADDEPGRLDPSEPARKAAQSRVH